MRAGRRGERSQAMTEFALVAPVLLLLTFGIIDFGRALYFYSASANAAREASRVAAVPNGLQLPTQAQVLAAAQAHFPGGTLTAPACPNGPIPSTQPAAGQGWLFTTEPGVAAGGAVEASPPPNAAGGDPPSPATGCSAVNPAAGRDLLQVTVIYNFVPVTPIVSSVIGNHVLFTLSVQARTEY